MPSIWIDVETFYDYVSEYGDPAEAKQQIKSVVQENKP